MPKLKRFNKKNRMNYKNIFISFAIIIGLITVFGIYKSYAIYKLQQDYDVIKNKIGTYSMGDVRVAVLVDGKETDTFPTYETNYKVESIDCTNGVTASFDVENWQLNIADMSSTSTKCTVKFNSKETNEIEPVNMSKTELLALNEEYQNLAMTMVVDAIYPVGSIYISTTDSSVDDVKARFPGTTWVKYSEGKTLIGEGTGTDSGSNSKTFTISENEINTGLYQTKLTATNLPNHTHKTTQTTTSTMSLNTAANSGAHTHTTNAYTLSTTNTTLTANSAGSEHSHTTGLKLIYNKNAKGTDHARIASDGTAISDLVTTSGGAHSHKITGTIPSLSIQSSGTHAHTVSGNVTIPALTASTCSDCGATAVNVQNPYTVVYMYKRTA